MNKSELIKVFSEKNELPIEESSVIVNIFFDSIKAALLNSQRVEIRGMGSFKIKEYQSYRGRNPKTGESVIVGAKRLPFFKAGKELKDFINS